MKRAQFLTLIGATLAISFSLISPARAQQQQQQQPQPQPVRPTPPASQNSSAAPAPLTAQQRADLVRKRAQWFHDQRAYPFQHIPPGALQRAIEQRDLMKKLQKAAAGRSQAVPNAVISFPGDALWHLTGPQPTNRPFGNFSGGGFSGYPTTSGRVTAIAVDPSDPMGNIVYIGGAA